MAKTMPKEACCAMDESNCTRPLSVKLMFACYHRRCLLTSDDNCTMRVQDVYARGVIRFSGAAWLSLDDGYTLRVAGSLLDGLVVNASHRI